MSVSLTSVGVESASDEWEEDAEDSEEDEEAEEGVPDEEWWDSNRF